MFDEELGELASGDQKEQLENWLKRSDFDPKEKVQAIIGIYNAYRIRPLAEAKMNEFFDQGFKLLESLNLIPNKIMPLKLFTKFLINREH